ncbi:MAG: Glu/Leu/Phe/Val dehydrogenase family protein [Deltaproteobacteria bacterium]|nr:Glu/Leu/Phe/Val dehydrogenase family protein [Deltaproteobacteria bacterium]
MHSNTLGINNGYHAIRAGGIRRHHPEAREMEVIIDGLNLSRAMSFKNAAADVPFGGSKITVQCQPVAADDLQAVGFLAYCLDRTRSVTGPDMGFTPELADVMKNKGYSRNIAGGYSTLGPTGRPTAYGVYLGLQEAVAFKYGSRSLEGKTIVVQGLGAVGYPLVAEYLAAEEVTIYCADIREEQVHRLTGQFPDRVKRIEPQEVLTFEADIFMPCAIGGILDEKAIQELNYKIVFGAANNQLKAVEPQEEIRLASLLAERGILFQVDWIHNAGGVIAGMEEYMYGEQASVAHIMEKTEKACKLGTRENLAAAARQGVTPTERAYRHYARLIYR